ncbi:MAG TPA: class I adenylate-forming enzyme family protein [Thermomicrobiaceae bacterium]|nr:class I adenylate-forming enzyme family protein [Thermomicrobiaceae bacterium]
MNGAPGTVETWSALLARRDARTPAVVAPGATWSMAELLARAGNAAGWLDRVRAPAGVPVPALVSASPPGLALALGAAASHRPLAPLGPRLTAHELGACVASLGGDLLVADRGATALAAEVSAATGRRVELLPDFDRGPARPLPFDPRPDALVAILHTSGTTGLPRPVEMREDRMAARVAVNRAVLDLGPGDLYASASGFHHIAGLGMQLAALAAGAAVALLPTFDIDAWRQVGELGITHALLVPTMIERLLAAGALATPRLRVLQYGAAPIHRDTLVAALEALPGVELVQVFGQTEGSPITYLSDHDHRRALAGRPELLASIGRAVPGTEIRVENPGRDGVGELCARGPHLFRIDPAGWLRTGDLALIDAEGYAFLAGRRGDKIIRGGENVYPVEVEDVLVQHPAVAEAAVVGVADREFGETIRAHVVLAPGASAGEGELQAFVRGRLAGFKVPTSWVFQTELPRSSLGKVVRRRLLEN